MLDTCGAYEMVKKFNDLNDVLNSIVFDEFDFMRLVHRAFSTTTFTSTNTHTRTYFIINDERFYLSAIKII